MTATKKKRAISGPLAVSLALITGVWAAGAVWSFDHQRRFAKALGFHHDYLLPAVSDGLPVAMAAVAFSASLDGRPATAARLGTALAVGGSAVSNGMYAWDRSSHDLKTVIVAVAIPVMAAIAFEILLGEVRKSVMQSRGTTPPVPVPHLRPIRVFLDPRREIAQWRRHVLTVTDPAADPVERAVLSRLVDALGASRPAPAGAAAGPNAVRAQAGQPGPEPVVGVEPGERFEAPRWIPETHAASNRASAMSPVVRAEAPAPGARRAAGETHATPRSALTETSPFLSGETSRSTGTETSRPALTETSHSRASETSRSADTETSHPSGPTLALETSRPVSRSNRSRPESRPNSSRPEAAGVKESAGAAAARGSQRARMAAYANAQLDAGVEITGADLDREFGTKNYGRAVLRDVKEARQPAATAGDEPAVPAQAGVPVGAGVSDG